MKQDFRLKSKRIIVRDDRETLFKFDVLKRGLQPYYRITEHNLLSYCFVAD